MILNSAQNVLTTPLKKKAKVKGLERLERYYLSEDLWLVFHNSAHNVLDTTLKRIKMSCMSQIGLLNMLEMLHISVHTVRGAHHSARSAKKMITLKFQTCM